LARIGSIMALFDLRQPYRIDKPIRIFAERPGAITQLDLLYLASRYWLQVSRQGVTSRLLYSPRASAFFCSLLQPIYLYLPSCCLLCSCSFCSSSSLRSGRKAPRRPS
jgi:hypothetical protein